MTVSKTAPFFIPASAIAAVASRPAHMDADQRYIRNPLLSASGVSECDELKWRHDLAAVGSAGAMGGIVLAAGKGLGLISRTKGQSDEAFMTGLGASVALLSMIGLLKDVNRLDDAYYQKCMVENPKYSPRAAAVEDHVAFTAAALLSSQQVVSGLASTAVEGSVLAAAFGFFAPFAVSLRSFATLHESNSNIL